VEPLPPEADRATPPIWIKARYICSRLLICGVASTLLAVGAALPDVEADVRAEEVEVVLVCVVVGGVEVGVGCAVVARVEVEVVLEDAGAPGAPPPKFHEPCRTPTDSEAKKLKRPREKSKPAKGQPGHKSATWAEVVLPLAVMVIVWKQWAPPAYCAAFMATMKSLPELTLPQAPRPAS